MLDETLLKTLKKHLQNIDGATSDLKEPLMQKSKILSFGEDMKSANEFIGALQIISITLKKAINIAKKSDTPHEIRLQIQEQLCLEIKELTEKCSFMGNSLFDATLLTSLGQNHFEFEINTPNSFLEEYDFENIIIYFEDKQDEIKQKLSLISNKISEANNQRNDYDFTKSSLHSDMVRKFY